MVMYVGHVISLLIYVAVLLTVISAAMKLNKAALYGQIKVIIPAFLVSLAVQASLFLVLQVDWITEDFNKVVGNTTAYLWLAFDYFNGFALLSFATALNVWLSWRDTKTGRTVYGRRKEDM